MCKLLLLFLCFGLIGCTSQEELNFTHSHSHIYVDELSEAQRKDLHSLYVMVNGQLQNRVSITERNGFRYVEANNIPVHRTGNGANGRNPHSIKEQNKSYKMTLNPEFANEPTKSFPNAFGVALNGVFFEPSTAEFWRGNRDWNQEAINGRGKRLLGLDENFAHVQPDGSYHYHGTPTGLIKNIYKKSRSRIMLIGYAADGFPIYSQYGYSKVNDPKSRITKLKSSYKLKRGSRPPGSPPGKYDGTYTADYEYIEGLGDLDEFNGRFAITPEYPKGIYHYVVTESFPFISRSWKGTPDQSFFKRGGQNNRERGPDDRRPPRRDGPPPRKDIPPPPLF